MKKTLIQIASFTLLAGAVALTPIQSQAQTSTNAPAAPKAEKPDVFRFHGKVVAINQTDKTLSVGKATYEVTSKSKIFNGKVPGTLEECAVGDIATGAFKVEGGRKVLVKLTFRKDEAAPGSASPSDAPDGKK